MEIVNKIVIITGGLGGIAIAAAKKLLQEDARNYYEENSIRTMVLCPRLTSTPLLKNDTATNMLAFLNELNLDSMPQQTPENVGFAISKMIKEGESGSVWIVEKNEPPYAAKSVQHFILE